MAIVENSRNVDDNSGGDADNVEDPPRLAPPVIPPPPIPKFPEDVSFNGIVQFKKGEREGDPRGGAKKLFRFHPEEGFEVLRAKIKSKAPAETTVSQVFFKAANNAAQSAFVELSEEIFAKSLRVRWKRISPQFYYKLTSNGKTLLDEFKFEFFVYTPRFKKRSALVLKCNPRAKESKRVALQKHVTTQSEDAEIEAANDDTSCVTTNLGAAHEQDKTEHQNGEANTANNFRQIGVRIQGQLLQFDVDVSSLRAVLGISQHDLFHQGPQSAAINQPVAEAGASNKSAADRIQEITQLRDQELITPDEFEQKRKEIINSI